MFLDFKTIKHNTVIQSDLCIIGAGAAGITIAREFDGNSLHVCLVESGGLEYEPVTQSLADGESIGLPYYPLDQSRLRFFGGTTNHWAGQCAPLSEMDFQVRKWVPYSGWPISRADLDPFYRRALPICELGPYVFDRRAWDTFGVEPPLFNPAKIQSHFWQNSRGPTRFGQVYREKLQNSENITVFLNANVTNIQTDKSGENVTHLDVAALNGNRGRIRARFFVLACGGMENPRLLLISNTVHPNGLGNSHDLVGRFFMDHASAMCGMVLAADVDSLLETYKYRHFEGTRFRPGMAIGKEEQIKSEVLNACATFTEEEHFSDGVHAGRQISDGLRNMKIPDNLTENILTILKDLHHVSKYLKCRLQGEEKCATVLLHLETRIEQAPNPNSRITLSSEKDALGLNRLRLDWQRGELEKKTLKTMGIALGSEFGRLNLGRVQLPQWLEQDGESEWMGGSYHHMGTTRMAENPKMGVVNEHCRMHGVNNLYLAGSSVFPTSGFVNPTFTIIALALRLADHLQLRMGEENF
ncbi:MAG TPA: GMC family oxidoreductase [Nitrospirales bacterium]|nr:GMC family oxidoreductase [Nitrospirales bacterium]